MQIVAQATVPTPGTPVRLTTTRGTFRGMRIWAEKANGAANTGAVYVGLAGMNKTTRAGVLFALATGTNDSFPPCSCAGLNPADIWIDADTANDGVRIVFF